jgi:hypothetical protein
MQGCWKKLVMRMGGREFFRRILELGVGVEWVGGMVV